MYAREYEVTFIVRPDLPDDDIQNIRTRTVGIIDGQQGTVLKNEDWGKRKLAYEVQKCAKGHFFLFNFLGNPSMVSEIERTLRLDDQVLRFLTVKVAERVEVTARIAEEETRRAQAAARPQSGMDDEEVDY